MYVFKKKWIASWNKLGLYLPEQAWALKVAYFTGLNTLQTSLKELFLINLSKTVLIRSLLNCQHLPNFSDWCALRSFHVSEGWPSGLPFRAPCPHRTPSAGLRGGHLPVDTTQRELHQWGRAHCGPGGGILHSQWELEWPAASGLHELQNRASGPRHGVWDQCAPHPARGGWYRLPWARPQDQDQVCWWVWGSWGRLSVSDGVWPAAPMQVAHAFLSSAGTLSGHRRSLHLWATTCGFRPQGLVSLRTSPPLFSLFFIYTFLGLSPSSYGNHPKVDCPL